MVMNGISWWDNGVMINGGISWWLMMINGGISWWFYPLVSSNVAGTSQGSARFSQRHLPAKPLSMERGCSSKPRLMTPEGKFWVNHHYPMIFPWYSHEIPPYLPVLSCCCWLSHQKLVWWWNMLLSICETQAEAKATPISKGPWHWISSAAARNASATLNSWCFWGFVAGSHPWDIPHGHLNDPSNKWFDTHVFIYFRPWRCRQLGISIYKWLKFVTCLHGNIRHRNHR